MQYRLAMVAIFKSLNAPCSIVSVPASIAIWLATADPAECVATLNTQTGF